MCGRYSISKKAREIGDYFNITIPEEFQGGIYNAAPTQPLPVVTMDNPAKMQLFHWGLQPSWENSPGNSSIMINARAESLREKKMFRNLIERKRCIIPADGFFEWEKTGKIKQPWRFLLKSEGLFAFAGLFNQFEDSEGNNHFAFLIITAKANPLIGDVHNRMPVILDQGGHKTWLSETSISGLDKLLEPFPADKMRRFKVSPKVNQASNNFPELIRPWQDPNLTLF